MVNAPGPQFQMRLAFLTAILVGLALVVLVRLAYWQRLPEDSYPRPIPGSHQLPVTKIPARRGVITDHRGVLVAIEVSEYNVVANPHVIEDPGSVARRLEALLGLPAGEIMPKLQDRSVYWVPLKGRISAGAAAEVTDAHLPGISLEPKPRRVYPMRDSGAHVIGIVTADGDAFYGVEERYNAEMAGKPGWWRGEEIIDPRQYQPAQDGASLVLTIDWTIQHMAEQALESAIAQHGAQGGTIIVMDPRTGAILALTNSPSFDPNRYGESPAERFVNPAISEIYEPGSVLKVITLAAGLEEGLISSETTYNDTGCVKVEEFDICNLERQPRGQTTMLDVMEHSLNVGAVHIALGLGAERFYSYFDGFGFGQPTNVDLPHEAEGIVRTPGSKGWSQLVLATNSFGQGIAATPLQVLAAVAAVGNDGMLMQPYIVERITYPGGRMTATEPVKLRQAVSAKTARTVTRILVNAIKEGLPQAVVPGYSVAGKTGTSQIPIQGGYDPNGTITSFAGYAPADDPRFAILIKIDRPRAGLGADVAAPLFKTLAEQLFTYYAIPPDDIRLAGMPNLPQEQANTGQVPRQSN